MAIKGIRDGNGGVIIPGQKLPFFTEGAQETSRASRAVSVAAWGGI